MSIKLGLLSLGNPETSRDGARSDSEIRSDEEMNTGCAVVGIVGFSFICGIITAITNPELVRSFLYATGFIR